MQVKNEQYTIGGKEFLLSDIEMREFFARQTLGRTRYIYSGRQHLNRLRLSSVLSVFLLGLFFFSYLFIYLF